MPAACRAVVVPMTKPTLLLLAMATLAHAAPLPFAIGTNTGGSGKSEGIYLSSFDPETGKFGEVKLGAKYDSPGFLALHPSKPILYSVGKSKMIPKGTLAAFKLGDTLTLLGDAWSGGSGPCHLALSASGDTIAAANYGDGSIAVLGVNSEGVPIAPILPIMKGEGLGPRKDRQESAHAHGVYFRGNLLFVPDLGLDKVLAFSVENTGPSVPKLAAHTTPFWASAPGAGPRHMDFSPDGRHAYVVNELDNTVTACSYDAKDGKFTTLHSITTLPEGEKPRNTTAEIAVHPNGKFVYASNRGHDSIAVFARDAASGKLTPVQIAPCGGKNPRHFAITPDGKWLLCAHQDSNSIAALPLDPATGKLSEPKASTPAPNPICILFLPAK